MKIEKLYCYLIEQSSHITLDNSRVFNPPFATNLRRITLIQGADSQALNDWLTLVKTGPFLPWIECISAQSPLAKLVNQGLQITGIRQSHISSPRSRRYDVLDFPDIEITHSWANWMARRMNDEQVGEIIEYSFLDSREAQAMWPAYVEAYKEWANGPALADVDAEELVKEGRRSIDVMRECLLLEKGFSLKRKELHSYGSPNATGLLVLNGVPLGTMLFKCDGTDVTITPSGGFGIMPKIEGLSEKAISAKTTSQQLVVSYTDFRAWLDVSALLTTVLLGAILSEEEGTSADEVHETEHALGPGVRPTDQIRMSGQAKIGDDSVTITATPTKDGEQIRIHIDIDNPKGLHEGSRILLDGFGKQVELQLRAHWKKEGKFFADGQLDVSLSDFLSGRTWENVVRGRRTVELSLSVVPAAGPRRLLLAQFCKPAAKQLAIRELFTRWYDATREVVSQLLVVPPLAAATRKEEERMEVELDGIKWVCSEPPSIDDRGLFLRCPVSLRDATGGVIDCADATVPRVNAFLCSGATCVSVGAADFFRGTAFDEVRVPISQIPIEESGIFRAAGYSFEVVIDQHEWDPDTGGVLAVYLLMS